MKSYFFWARSCFTFLVVPFGGFNDLRVVGVNGRTDRFADEHVLSVRNLPLSRRRPFQGHRNFGKEFLVLFSGSPTGKNQNLTAARVAVTFNLENVPANLIISFLLGCAIARVPATLFECSRFTTSTMWHGGFREKTFGRIDRLHDSHSSAAGQCRFRWKVAGSRSYCLP